VTVAVEQTFAPPGPGTWFLDPTHFSRPATRFHAELFVPEFIRGFGEGFLRYGSLLEYLDWAFVNGFPYFSPRPVGAPPEAVEHPPKEIWDELSRTDPEIRRRLETSASVFERKLWRQDLERFDKETKPAAVREHLALLAVEPRALPTDKLLAYIDRCRENQKRGCYLQYLYTVPALLPIGDFVVHAQEWTGRSPAELLGLMQGTTPDPLGAADDLERFAEAVHQDREATVILESEEEPAELLSKLRGRPGETGAAAAAYIDWVGYRPVNGEDVGDPNVIELPGLIVETMRTALEPLPGGPGAGRLEERTAAVRAFVPSAHRDEFDELLGEARALYRLRDERGTYLGLWGIGIMRRAILAGGERLAEEGRIELPEHLVEADYGELQGLVVSGDGPSPAELAERARYRSEASYRDAPPFLGPEPGLPLPPEWLPPASARLERAIGAAVQAIFLAPEPRTEAARVRGLGVSPGVHEGTARIIQGPNQFGRLQKGDVLVTNSTTAAFNIVLPLLGAIVTDRGGLLSHAAIVAREFGIPAVVGCSDATAVLPDGVRVRVDGAVGEVEVVS
jgi:rifampicin phosphotransferase